MADLLALIFGFSFIALFVLIPIWLYNRKKNEEKSLKFFKFTKITSIVMVASFILFAIFDDSKPQSEESQSLVSADNKEKEESSEEKATREAKEKKEAEEKAAAEAEAKKKEEASAAEKLEAEKNFYLNEVKSKVDTQMKMYDAAWAELWVPTFEGLGTSVDIYTAYDNMKALKQRYDTLYASFPSIEGEKLSKENKKQLKEFTDGMKNASMWRSEAAKKAMKIFDEGDYSPSRMDKLKTDIEYADSQMMTAVVALTMLEMTLGVEREQ